MQDSTGVRGISITEAQGEFLRAKRRQSLSPETIESYRKVLDKFRGFAGDIDMADLDRKLVEKFVDWLIDRGARKVTIAHDARHLKVFCRWAYAEQIAPVNAFAGLVMPKEEVGLTPLIPDADFIAMLAACDRRTLYGRRDHAMLCFLWDTGVRVSELCLLRREDVDLDNRIAKVYGKGSKWRYVFFSPETAESLGRYHSRLRMPQRERFFIAANTQTMKRASVRATLGRIAKRAGVTSRVNPHTFRHTFATNYLRAGGDLNSLARMLGHTSANGQVSLAVVSRYLSLVTEDLSRKHDQFSPMHRLSPKL